MLRVAVVGVGQFGAQHAEAYRRRRDVELVALVDPSLPPGLSNGTPVFAGVDELLACVRPDAASVAVPEHAHVPVAERLLSSGVSVLLEKPVAPTAEEACGLARTAQHSGAIVVPAHLLRFSPPHRRLRAAAIGDVVAASFRRDRSRALSTRYPAVHPALLTMVHDIDLALWLVPGRPVAVRALERRLDGLTQPSAVFAHVEFDSGAVASFSAAYLLPEGDADAVSDRIDLYGTLGAAAYDSAAECDDADASDAPPLDAEIAHFLDCVRAGSPSTVVTMDDAATGLRVAEAIIRSAANGSVEHPLAIL